MRSSHCLCSRDHTQRQVLRSGDTLTVLINDRPVKIRLHAIDAPEAGQPFGARAKEFLGGLCFRKEVTIRQVDTDSYGRVVPRVTLPDQRVVNLDLVRAGLAWWYRRYAPTDDDKRYVHPIL